MRRASKVAANLAFVLICLIAVGAVFYWQQISDYVKVQSYEPSASIAQLADRSGMSDKGRFYFYVTSPRLDTADEFNEECRRAEQGSPILGCYNQGSDTIHIYNIDNPELDGIKEVTAAHEMLHAAFARLSNSDIAKLTPQLEEAYNRLKTDDLTERMAYYERNAPGSRINELHSIIGTEFSDIGPQLEEYYAKYFDNRQAVVALHQNYSQKFQAIENEITALTSRLEQLQVEINNMTDDYERRVQALNSRIEEFNQRATSGYFNSQSEFSQARAQLNQQIASLNGRRAEITWLIDQYNADVARLNQLGGKMNELQRGLDSLQGVEQGVEAI